MPLGFRSFRAAMCATLALGLGACDGPHPPSRVVEGRAPVSLAAPHPTSTDLAGRPVDPLAPADGRKAAVLLFITNDCPISNGYAPEIRRLCQAYGHRGIAFYLVYSDPDLKFPDARRHYHDYGYTCAALMDPLHDLAKKAGATVTPEAAVFRADGRLIYRGRIDDFYVDFGKARYAATTHDLKDVLEQVSHDRPPAFRATAAVGCAIPQ